MGVSRPIKVMHIIARMNVGGPAVEIVELMRGLDPQLVSQRLVTGYCDEDEADYLETQAPDIQATRIQGLGRSIRPTDDAKALARLIKLIRISRPDIVHTHTAKAGALGRLAAKFSGTRPKIIHTYHGHLLFGYFGKTKTRAWIQAEKRLAMITDQLVSVGDEVQRELLKAGVGTSSQFQTIRSGVQLKQPPTKAAAREMLGLDQESPVVSMLSRLSQIKRPDRFLDVAEGLARDGVSVQFLIAGGGDLAESVKAEAARRQLPVVVVGWRNDPETVLAASDILLVTSDNEGIPLTMVQAGLVEVPSVSTNVGSVGEYIEDGVSGLLCETSAEDLSKAIRMLLANPTKRRAMGAEARRISVNRFANHRYLKQHATIYGISKGLSGPRSVTLNPRSSEE